MNKIIILIISVLTIGCTVNDHKELEKVKNQFPNARVLIEPSSRFTFTVIDSSGVFIVCCYNFTNSDISKITKLNEFK